MLGHSGTPPAPIEAQGVALALQSDSGDDGVVLLVFFVVGLALIYNGFDTWKRMRLMQDTPTERVRSAAAGRTELMGTATPIEDVGTLEQPFADGDCLVATYAVEEWEDDQDDDGGNWETIDSGTLTRPFALDDGTGRMRVEPEADATYEISEANTTRFRVSARERPPTEVSEFFQRRGDDGDDDGLLGGLLDGDRDARAAERRRYTQEVLPPDEEAYLLGGAQPASGADGSNADRLVLGRDEASDRFVVSDRTEEELTARYRWRAPAQIVGGLALSAAMLYLLLS